jgi:hypothetical protein
MDVAEEALPPLDPALATWVANLSTAQRQQFAIQLTGATPAPQITQSASFSPNVTTHEVHELTATGTLKLNKANSNEPTRYKGVTAGLEPQPIREVESDQQSVPICNNIDAMPLISTTAYSTPELLQVQRQPLFAEGELVEVARRKMPGFNFEGGSAIVKHINDEEQSNEQLKDGSHNGIRTTRYA